MRWRWSASCSGHFTSGEGAPFNHWGLGGTTDSLDVLEKRRNSCPPPGSEPWTDWNTLDLPLARVWLNQLTWPRSFLLQLNSSKQILWYYIEIVHNWFLLPSYLLIVHYSFRPKPVPKADSVVTWTKHSVIYHLLLRGNRIRATILKVQKFYPTN